MTHDWKVRALVLAPLVLLLMGAAVTMEYQDASIPSSALQTTGVTPGTYADATHVDQVTFNGQGQATGATSVAIATMTGATNSTPGTIGFFPAPTAGQQNFVPEGDGLWHLLGTGGTVSSLGCGSTMTCTPSPITVTGSVDINLSNANNWTAPQKFPIGGSTTIANPVMVVFTGATATPSLTSGVATGDTAPVPANALSTDGYAIRVTAKWTHAANTNSAQLNVRWGGSALCQLSDAVSGDIAKAIADVTRTSSSTLLVDCWTQQGATFNRTTTTITSVNFAIANNVTDTISATTANGDATTASLRVEFIGS